MLISSFDFSVYFFFPRHTMEKQFSMNSSHFHQKRTRNRWKRLFLSNVRWCDECTLSFPLSFNRTISCHFFVANVFFLKCRRTATTTTLTTSTSSCHHCYFLRFFFLLLVVSNLWIWWANISVQCACASNVCVQVYARTFASDCADTDSVCWWKNREKMENIKAHNGKMTTHSLGVHKWIVFFFSVDSHQASSTFFLLFIYLYFMFGAAALALTLLLSFRINGRKKEKSILQQRRRLRTTRARRENETTVDKKLPQHNLTCERTEPDFSLFFFCCLSNIEMAQFCAWLFLRCVCVCVSTCAMSAWQFLGNFQSHLEIERRKNRAIFKQLHGWRISSDFHSF